jgi:uncharacterized membrane protein YciS (DUF1049 family)
MILKAIVGILLIIVLVQMGLLITADNGQVCFDYMEAKNKALSIVKASSASEAIPVDQ